LKIKIEEVEPRFAERLSAPLKTILDELRYSIPHRHKLRVSLLDTNGRKKRSNASADNWSPEAGRIELRFEPVEPDQAAAPSRRVEAILAPDQKRHSPSGHAAHEKQIYMHPAEAEVLAALDRAESRPGWSFVPLKKFRDEILASEHLPSVRTDVERQSVLRSAIEKRFILVGKVPNPKAPEFPVTTIRLNRLLPEVQGILESSGSQDSDFHPVEIPGEPLSATILRERR
jgi:hypothetical protein